MRRFAYAAAAAAALLIALVLRQPAQADTLMISHRGIYTEDVVIPRDQVVEGDVTAIGGNVTVEGRVHGNVTVIGGSLDSVPGSVITGETSVFGGNVAQSVVPWTVAGGQHHFRLGWDMVLAVVVLLFFLIFPARTRTALDRLERHPGLCGAIGLVGCVALIPIAFMLLCTIVLIPLIAVEAIAFAAGVLIGEAALALLIGRRLYEMLSPQSTATPLVALVLGLVVITAAEMVPIVGFLVQALVWLIGFGAAILAFVRETAFTGGMPQEPVRRTISGPPMTPG